MEHRDGKTGATDGGRAGIAGAIGQAKREAKMIRAKSSVPMTHRLRFAARYALRHMVLSLLVALASAGVVFGLWYAAP